MNQNKSYLETFLLKQLMVLFMSQALIEYE